MSAPMQRIRKFMSSARLIVAAAGSLVGCADSTGAGGATPLSILLTDAPGDMQVAVVTISEIYLQGTGGRVVLMDTPVTTDLLTLANSTAELVKDAIVPAGSYEQLRFVITGGYIAVEGDNGGTAIYASSSDYAGLPEGAVVNGTLQMPSFAQTGIKVNMLGDESITLDGEQKVLLVDFDVARSFGQQAGASGSWVMTPVLEATEFKTSASIRVTARLGEGVTMPAVNGTATTLGDVKAVLSTSEQIALTDANGDGAFEAVFSFVIPGDYTVALAPPAGVTMTTDPATASVSVGSGESATQAFTVTAAAAQ